MAIDIISHRSNFNLEYLATNFPVKCTATVIHSLQSVKGNFVCEYNPIVSKIESDYCKCVNILLPQSTFPKLPNIKYSRMAQCYIFNWLSWDLWIKKNKVYYMHSMLVSVHTDCELQ